MDKKGRKSSNTSRTKRKTTSKTKNKKVAGSTNKKRSGGSKSSSDQRRRSTARPPVAQQRRNSTQQNRPKQQNQQNQQKPQAHGSKDSSGDKGKPCVSGKTASKKQLLWDDDDDDDSDGSDVTEDDFPIPLSPYVGTNVPFDYCKRDVELGCCGFCLKAWDCPKASRSTCWGVFGILCCTVGSLVTLFGFIVSWALCTTHPTLISGVALIVFGCLVALFSLVIYPRVKSTRRQQQRIADIDEIRAREFNSCLDRRATPVAERRTSSGVIPSAPPIPPTYTVDIPIHEGGSAASWPMRGRRRHSEPYVIVVSETHTLPRISGHLDGHQTSSTVNVWEPIESVSLMGGSSRDANELSVIYENEMNEESDTT